VAGIGLHVANHDRTDKTKAHGAVLGVPSWPSDGEKSCIRHAMVRPVLQMLTGLAYYHIRLPTALIRTGQLLVWNEPKMLSIS
jgi:hypothetical protein